MRNLITILVRGTSACTNEQSGQVIGGILGSGAGSQVGSGRGRAVATVADAIAGGYIGGNVGRGMDETDRHKAQRTQRKTTHIRIDQIYTFP